MTAAGRVYTGTVVHKRLRPKPHALRYDVFSLLLDVDGIDDFARRSRIFSRNRVNFVSFYDRDHGPGDGAPIGGHARAVLASRGFDVTGGRILLLAYPRVLGYVFNPISVYYALDRAGVLIAVIYEVNNTFGERKSYVVAAGEAPGGVHAHGCEKELFVSPFAPEAGRYGFRVTFPGERLLVGVTLRDAEGPLIKTHFSATAEPLTDGVLAGRLLRFPLLSLKVIGAIHLEAVKLWLKGVPFVRGHRSPRYSINARPATGQG